MRPTSQPALPKKTDRKKSKDLDLKSIKPALIKLLPKLSRHLSFIITIVVLLAYLFVVWQIRGFVAAEPTPEAEAEAISASRVPKIDQKAVDRIQSLEKSSSAVRALFNEARNNPFHE